MVRAVRVNVSNHDSVTNRNRSRTQRRTAVGAVRQVNRASSSVNSLLSNGRGVRDLDSAFKKFHSAEVLAGRHKSLRTNDLDKVVGTTGVKIRHKNEAVVVDTDTEQVRLSV